MSVTGFTVEMWVRMDRLESLASSALGFLFSNSYFAVALKFDPPVTALVYVTQSEHYNPVCLPLCTDPGHMTSCIFEPETPRSPLFAGIVSPLEDLIQISSGATGGTFRYGMY